MTSTGNAKLSNEISVYLLADNRLLRDTLARLLRKKSEINVAGVGGSSEAAKEAVLVSHCDVLLMDSFDNEVCSSVLEGVTEENCGVKLILFGMDNDAERFLRAVHLGICGYLLKEASAAEIVAAVRAAARGEATCPPSLCMALMQFICKRKYEKFETESMGCNIKNLTPRQLQLLRLVAEGLTNKEIAANLNLSQFTVKNHLRRVMRQVEATSRYDAVDLLRASGQLAT